MTDIIRVPDRFKIHYDKADIIRDDGVIRFEGIDGKLKVLLTATRSKPAFVELRWYCRTQESVKVLGDEWERAYGDMMWKGIHAENFMPWYFFVKGENEVLACGVETKPASFVSWSFDKEGISAWLDVRCGGSGVELGGRELEAATIVSKVYKNMSSFEAACRFCKVMCPDPVLPENPVYGGNNWYYAYGESSYADIINDAKLQSELAPGLSNRPYMVIDDGWQINSTSGPWEPNEKFIDMSALALDIKEMRVHPGIWVRYLHTHNANVPDIMKIKRPDGSTDPFTLDPSHPKVLQYVARETRKLVSWGYELIKHDYSTFDIFGNWGKDVNGKITEDGWCFYDRAKTGAEIVRNFYRTIYENAGEALILGCNCISHLTAGYAHLNRVGDDTSGTSWARTRKMGINSLAFRLPQNRAFYMIDADCVGFIKGKIKWKYNKQWLDLLSRSGTPLFISCARGTLSDDELRYVRDAYAHASRQKDTIEPLDWEDTTTPDTWLLNGKEELHFEWYGNGAMIE
ncbi:MAG: hypothetical protein J5562_08295 [Clostridia bacterium]|nr:hypothetical protein [Clostridia bacterium]